MQSHHKFNEHKTVESVVNRIKGGETVALISDAGTPGISDPGFLVVRECVRNGIEAEDYRAGYRKTKIQQSNTSDDTDDQGTSAGVSEQTGQFRLLVHR